jgi:hypothetical protein
LVYSAIEITAGDKITTEIKASLNDSKKWMMEMRDVIATVSSGPDYQYEGVINLSYDVNAWYFENSEKMPLVAYKKDISYEVYQESERIKNIFSGIKKLYGPDIKYQFGQFLIRWDIENLWRKSK